jgi:hypothetical protein
MDKLKDMGSLLAGHEAALKRIAEGLGKDRLQVIALGEALLKLEAEGVFLNGKGAPVVPGWWERVEKGVHKGWYLVWPTWHARSAEISRRQYVRAADVGETRLKVERTARYDQLKAARDGKVRRLKSVESDLGWFASRWGW